MRTCFSDWLLSPLTCHDKLAILVNLDLQVSDLVCVEVEFIFEYLLNLRLREVEVVVTRYFVDDSVEDFALLQVETDLFPHNLPSLR